MVSSSSFASLVAFSLPTERREGGGGGSRPGGFGTGNLLSLDNFWDEEREASTDGEGKIEID